MAATTPRYTLRALGADSTTNDGTRRELHGDNLDDLHVISMLSRFHCEIVDNVTNQIVRTEAGDLS